MLAAYAYAAPAVAQPPPGTPGAFADLPGFAADDLGAALGVFRVSCAARAAGTLPSRPAQPPPPGLEGACAAAARLPASVDAGTARRFFEAAFVPLRVGLPGSAFFTGYYEPVVEGSLVATRAFATPLRAAPADLVAATPGHPFPGLDPTLQAARRRLDGTYLALPDRAAIEAGALGDAAPPLAFVRDPVEAFFIQVQGSARIALPDGSLRRLVYAGRNGYPYTSIGKVLVARLGVPPDQMGMTQLKNWIRAHGEGGLGEAGTALMQMNRSYIFFRFDDKLPENAGPVGGSGVGLTALRSLAVDRGRWSYGLPMYVDVELPWAGDAPSPFRRLMVAQDTGSAIVGPARADIFFGTGGEAARRAGAIRHPGTLWVLWPKDAATGGRP